MSDFMAGFDPDWIVHCAASYDDRLKWHRDVNTNVQGSINVAIAAKQSGARVLYFQTALIYGNNPKYLLMAATNEVEALPIQTTDPCWPENSYAISKFAGGQYLRHADIPLLEFRLANIYGPRNLSGPVPTFYKRLSEGQTCTVTDTRRDFVYIQDLVELVNQAINENATGTYHVSTGRDYPIHELFTTVANAMDIYAANPNLVDRGADDASTILLDPSETQRDFSWVATTDLDEGVEQAVAWYRDNGVQQTYTHLAQKG
jgi:UDP-glucose 4-epimerase